MKKGWEYKKLGEVCTSINGLWKGKKPPFIKVGVIRNANFKKDFTLDFSKIEYLDVEEKKFAKRKLEIGDLIIERSGGSEKQPVGRAVLFDEGKGDFSFSNFTSVVRINDKQEVSPLYLFKYLLYVYLKGETKSMQNAAIGLHNLDFERYLNIEIPVPPLSEQQRIVSYLDAAFAKIDAVAKNAEDSLNEAKALFQSALTKMMESKEGWEEVTLEEICTSVNYGTSKPSIENGKYKYLRMNNITNDGFLDLSHYKTITLSGKELDKSIVKRGDILFNRTNSRELVGKSCVFTDEEPMVIAGYLIRIKLKAGYDPQFVTYNMNLQRYLGKFKGLIVGAVHQANISAKNIQTINIAVPSLSTQQSIVSTLDSLKSKVDQLQSNLTRTLSECAALKQSILRETFE